MNFPKRVSKQPIFISILTEHPEKNKLSGKYNFHSIQNNAAVFVTDGTKIEKLSGPYPYYLAYNNGIWNLQDSDYFEEIKGKGEGGGWLKLSTKGFFCIFLSLSKFYVKKLITFPWKLNGKLLPRDQIGVQKEP